MWPKGSGGVTYCNGWRMATAGHSNKPYDVCYKVLLIGDSGVGKSALIHALTGQGFKPSYVPTVGIDFVKMIFEVDGARVMLEIWDTAGQERFRTITRFQYRGTKGLLLVYDITSMASFSMLDYWLESIDKDIDRDNKEPIPVFILGNKCDLDPARQVSTEQGAKSARDNLVHGFLETSAKETINVSTAFWQLALAITEINSPRLMTSYLTPNERQEKEQTRMGQIFNTFRLSQLDLNKKKHRKCCV